MLLVTSYNYYVINGNYIKISFYKERDYTQ